MNGIPSAIVMRHLMAHPYAPTTRPRQSTPVARLVAAFVTLAVLVAMVLALSVGSGDSAPSATCGNKTTTHGKCR